MKRIYFGKKNELIRWGHWIGIVSSKPGFVGEESSEISKPRKCINFWVDIYLIEIWMQPGAIWKQLSRSWGLFSKLKYPWPSKFWKHEKVLAEFQKFTMHFRNLWNIPEIYREFYKLFVYFRDSRCISGILRAFHLFFVHFNNFLVHFKHF